MTRGTWAARGGIIRSLADPLIPHFSSVVRLRIKSVLTAAFRSGIATVDPSLLFPQICVMLYVPSLRLRLRWLKYLASTSRACHGRFRSLLGTLCLSIPNLTGRAHYRGKSLDCTSDPDVLPIFPGRWLAVWVTKEERLRSDMSWRHAVWAFVASPCVIYLAFAWQHAVCLHVCHVLQSLKRRVRRYTTVFLR
jgi:hypothetical protein